MSTGNNILQTNNTNLQQQLNIWQDLIALCASSSGDDKRNHIMNFCRSFVPPDVLNSPEDLEYFHNNLCNDEEYFSGVKRDINQCASGICVESITPTNQIKKATFVLLPLPNIGKFLCVIVLVQYIYICLIFYGK